MKGTGEYPENWIAIAHDVKAAAAWRCIRCTHDNDAITGHVLTTHHADGDKGNNRWWNLLALCQRCHLSIQGRVNLHQPWLFEHSKWFRPYVAGFYAFQYADLDLTREQVEGRLDEFLALGKRGRA